MLISCFSNFPIHFQGSNVLRFFHDLADLLRNFSQLFPTKLTVWKVSKSICNELKRIQSKQKYFYTYCQHLSDLFKMETFEDVTEWLNSSAPKTESISTQQNQFSVLVAEQPQQPNQFQETLLSNNWISVSTASQHLTINSSKTFGAKNCGRMGFSGIIWVDLLFCNYKTSIVFKIHL